MFYDQKDWSKAENISPEERYASHVYFPILLLFIFREELQEKAAFSRFARQQMY